MAGLTPPRPLAPDDDEGAELPVTGRVGGDRTSPTGSSIAVCSTPGAVGPPMPLGAVALYVVSALAVYGGDRLRRVVPAVWLTRTAALILVVLAVLTLIEAITG